jgi:hypothetical protein
MSATLERDNVPTPPWLMAIFEGWYDPCPLNTELREIDGGEPPKGSKIYVNPPYSNQPEWIERAIKWHQEGHVVVMLIPIETSTLKAKRLIQYGVRRLYFDKRPYEKVRGVELVILTG